MGGLYLKSRGFQKTSCCRTTVAMVGLPHSLQVLAFEDMASLTKRELVFLDATAPHYKVFLVETEVGERRGWRMRVSLPDQEKTFDVVTLQGNKRVWLRLDVALPFVEEACPGAIRNNTVFLQFLPRTGGQFEGDGERNVNASAAA